MLFEISDIVTHEKICVAKDSQNSGLEGMNDRLSKRFIEKHYEMISAIGDVGLPLPGQQFRLVTRRSFNSIQLIEYIARRETISHMAMAVYSINFNAAKILVGLVNDRKILKLDILMSNLRNKAHREKEVIVNGELSSNEHISLFFCQSHAKVFSCKTEAGNFYTLEGSGNMTYNSRVEQYVIDNDKLMYEFTCSWIADIKKFLYGTKEMEIASER